MFIFSRRTNFLSILLIFFICFNVSKVKGSDFIFEHSIHLALKNSLELKAQNYRLAAAKHSLGEANSSKDWKNSFSTVFNSTNKDSNSNGFFGEDDTTTSTISISKNIFDGGEAFEKYSIAEDNLKLQRANLIKVKQKIILEAIKAYLDVYSNQSVVRLRKRSLNSKSSQLSILLRDFVFPYFKTGQVKCYIDSVFSLSEASKAHKRLDEGVHIGKVILKI